MHHRLFQPLAILLDPADGQTRNSSQLTNVASHNLIVIGAFNSLILIEASRRAALELKRGHRLGLYTIVWQAYYFTTRCHTNVLSTRGGLSSEESTRNDIRSIPWKVYHRLVALPTAFGVWLIS
jgi:hypothetical protein